MTMKTDEARKIISLDFPIDYYSYEAIIHACRDFCGHFWISVGQDARGFMVLLEPKEPLSSNLDEIGYEFYNYVLGTMQQLSA